jgi:hypothetical protein
MKRKKWKESKAKERVKNMGRKGRDKGVPEWGSD